MSLKPMVKEVEHVCISTQIPLPASALYLKPDQVSLNHQKLDGGENYPVVRQKAAWLISSSGHTRTQTPDLQLPSSDPLHLKEREHPNLGFPRTADTDKCAADCGGFHFYSGLSSYSFQDCAGVGP